MKTASGFLVCTGALYLLLALPASAQEKPSDITHKRVRSHLSTPQPQSESIPRYRIPGKKASQYTAEDWGKLIDSTWGPGQTAAEQLTIFDSFWNAIDQKWAGFPNVALNWDSVRTVYRPQIGSGLSRGRFYALMSRISLVLLELHSYIIDPKVDSTFGATTWHYERGIPLLLIGPWGGELIGAVVTPMPDSSGLVYRVAPGNPLGLVPGDLILGYEGIPWKRLYTQLLDDGVPVCQWWSPTGSTPESRIHMALSGVGRNWGLFDTIDVVKYSTGDTLHLPTASLSTLSPAVWATDQIPIAGVPMPQGSAFGGTGPSVSWGVVQGTNIGYLYVWDWQTTGTSQLFHDAIFDLRYNKKVDGLIIDFRTNWGGGDESANAGLSQLYNFDPTANLFFANRSSLSNHMSFSTSGKPVGPIPTVNPFDRPIAVLIGPTCQSAGDFNAFLMRFHPMVRFFGKPTNGAFAWASLNGTLNGGWQYNFPTGIFYSSVSGEGYLIHKGVQPDEEVWLTRDGVAKGEDDVVKRAIGWITSLSYSHDAKVPSGLRPNVDTVKISALVANPQKHNLSIWSYLSNKSGIVLDSSQMFDDGMHNDGKAGDSLYGGSFPPLANEGMFGVSLRTTDITAGTYRYLPNARHFFTSGPIVCKNFVYTTSDTIPNPGDVFRVRFRLANNGKVETVKSVTASVTASDTMISLGSALPIDFGDLSPGKDSLFAFRLEIKVNPACPSPRTIRLFLSISSEGYPAWTDSVRIVIQPMGIIASDNTPPIEYSLAQNYPNPFNPTTVISYQLPVISNVTLKIYDVLGREVVTLVNEKKDAGWYSVQWDASTRASEIYFYTLQAGEYRDTKRMLLLK